MVLDTDVASHVMRGSLPGAVARRLRGAALAVTFVTVGELYRGAAHGRWGSRRLAALAEWLAPLPVLSGSESVARRWGELTGNALIAGRPLPSNDAWIAACCLANDAALATLNVRHYADIADLDLAVSS
ncbi:MAG: PIN domain-containing protein [Thermoleophilaceae bacterium]